LTPPKRGGEPTLFRPNTSGQRGDATRRGIAGTDATQAMSQNKQGRIPGPRECALPRRQNHRSEHPSMPRKSWAPGQSPSWHPPSRSRPLWNNQPNFTTIADSNYDESVEIPP
jgi:hypothetical protein